MKNMALLIDTNVLINYITKRDDPYKIECENLMEFCDKGHFQGYVAFHSLATIWYVVCKHRSEKEARDWIENICDMMWIVSATQDQVKHTIRNKEFRDFEDCLQDACAEHAKVDYIVTCNAKDFIYAKTKVVTPDIMLQMLNAEE